MRLLLKLLLVIVVVLLFSNFKGIAQQAPGYPRVVGYFSLTNPIGTWNKDGFKSNFNGEVYSIAFPFGMNILKSDHFGVSFEVSPSIRTEKQVFKVNSVVFHPGAIFRFKHGFTFIGRMAFETNGRFGVTPVLTRWLCEARTLTFLCRYRCRLGLGMINLLRLVRGCSWGCRFKVDLLYKHKPR